MTNEGAPVLVSPQFNKYKRKARLSAAVCKTMANDGLVLGRIWSLVGNDMKSFNNNQLVALGVDATLASDLIKNFKRNAADNTIVFVPVEVISRDRSRFTGSELQVKPSLQPASVPKKGLKETFAMMQQYSSIHKFGLVLDAKGAKDSGVNLKPGNTHFNDAEVKRFTELMQKCCDDSFVADSKIKDLHPNFDNLTPDEMAELEPLMREQSLYLLYNTGNEQKGTFSSSAYLAELRASPNERVTLLDDASLAEMALIDEETAIRLCGGDKWSQLTEDQKIGIRQLILQETGMAFQMIENFASLDLERDRNSIFTKPTAKQNDGEKIDLYIAKYDADDTVWPARYSLKDSYNIFFINALMNYARRRGAGFDHTGLQYGAKEFEYDETKEGSLLSMIISVAKPLGMDDKSPSSLFEMLDSNPAFQAAFIKQLGGLSGDFEIIQKEALNGFRQYANDGLAQYKSSKPLKPQVYNILGERVPMPPFRWDFLYEHLRGDIGAAVNAGADHFAVVLTSVGDTSSGLRDVVVNEIMERAACDILESEYGRGDIKVHSGFLDKSNKSPASKQFGWELQQSSQDPGRTNIEYLANTIGEGGKIKIMSNIADDRLNVCALADAIAMGINPAMFVAKDKEKQVLGTLKDYVSKYYVKSTPMLTTPAIITDVKPNAENLGNDGKTSVFRNMFAQNIKNGGLYRQSIATMEAGIRANYGIEPREHNVAKFNLQAKIASASDALHQSSLDYIKKNVDSAKLKTSDKLRLISIAEKSPENAEKCVDALASHLRKRELRSQAGQSRIPGALVAPPSRPSSVVNANILPNATNGQKMTMYSVNAIESSTTQSSTAKPSTTKDRPHSAPPKLTSR